MGYFCRSNRRVRPPERFTDLEANETTPVTSHDGRTLAYRALYPGPSFRETIRLVHVGTGMLSGEIELPSPVRFNVTGIDFSEDDRHLVFGADATDVGGSLQNVHGEIFSIDLDGTHLTRLTRNKAFDGYPVSLVRAR